MTSSVYIKKTRIESPVESVFAWHERPGAILRLSPPWDRVQLVKQRGGINIGARVHLKIFPIGPLPLNWHARHTEYEKNRFFRDVQEKGPFKRWRHTHRFKPVHENACLVEDHIEYALPFHPVTRPVFNSAVKARLEAIFAYRHKTLADDIKDHEKHALNPMNILISGSRGLIGTALAPFLTTGGHRVYRLNRTASGFSPERPPAETAGRAPGHVRYNPHEDIIDINNMENIDALIHLAGENVGNGPWTARKKKRIMESRTKSTALLAESLAKLKNPPKLFACASAIGYYGDREALHLDESAEPGSGFLSEVCQAWEAAAMPAINAGIRTVFLRIGIVLTPLGGALQKMLPVFRAGLGGRIGDGRQYMSWIGIDDVAGAVLHLMATPSVNGPVNLVSPNPVSNREFSDTLATVLSRPCFFNVPEVAIKAVSGRMGEETLLSGARVNPEKLLASGYRFRHPQLAGLLMHTLGKTPWENRL